MISMIPGDAVEWSAYHYGDYGTVSTGGTFDETYEFSVSLPPEPILAAVPTGIAWLLGGVLLGLGIKVLRQQR